MGSYSYLIVLTILLKNLMIEHACSYKSLMDFIRLNNILA